MLCSHVIVIAQDDISSDPTNINFYLFRLPSISNSILKYPELAYKAGNGLCCQPFLALLATLISNYKRDWAPPRRYIKAIKLLPIGEFFGIAKVQKRSLVT
jgi:hypothetical protein